jgi:transaldolase
MYIEALAAPDTINTIPEKMLLAFADHGQVKGVLPRDGGDAEEVLAEFRRAGIHEAALAAELQHEAAEAPVGGKTPRRGYTAIESRTRTG